MELIKLKNVKNFFIQRNRLSVGVRLGMVNYSDCFLMVYSLFIYAS